MSDRTSSEIHDIITELEKPFKAVPTVGANARSMRDRIAFLDELISLTHDYTQDMSPLLTDRVSVGPAMIPYWRNRMVADMRNELRIHNEPVGGRKRDTTAADKLEVLESHWLLKLWGDSDIRENIHMIQALGFFWAGWLEMGDWQTPDQADGEKTADYNSRVDQAMKEWFPHQIVEHHPEAVSYAEHGRTLTMAGVSYKLPVVEVLRRYSGKEIDRRDTGALMGLLNGDFGFLKADEPGKSDSALDAFSRQVTVYQVADGDKISHCVDLGKGEANERYRALGDDRDNPYGQVPLLLASGIYVPNMPIAYRRMGLLNPLASTEDAKALMKSVWASKAASEPFWVELMPKELNPDQAGEKLAFVRGADGTPQIARSWAVDVKALENTIDPHQDKLYQVLADEAAQMAPSGLLNADASTLAHAPSTTVLSQLDEARSMIGSATRIETAMWGRVLDMVTYAFKNKLNKHRKAGEPKRKADWEYGFTTTGKEYVKGRKVKHGEAFDVTPQDFDTPMTRVIDPVDTRLSTQAANMSYWDSRYRSGWATFDETLEGVGIEAKDTWKEEKTADALYQLEVPRIIEASRMKYAQAQAIWSGRPVEELLQEIAVEPLAQAAAASGGSPAGGTVVRQGSGVTDNPTGAQGAVSA